MDTSKNTIAEDLREWEREHGVCWVSEIHKLAKAGETWGIVADLFGVPEHRLKAFCHRRGFEFPWQGRSSYRFKESLRNYILENPIKKPSPPKYYAFGEYKTFLDHCSDWGVEVGTVRARIRKQGLTLEASLKKPVMSKSEVGRYARSRRGKGGMVQPQVIPRRIHAKA